MIGSTGRHRNEAAAPPIDILVLAAGASRRFKGGRKLLQPIAGTPMIARTLSAYAQVQREGSCRNLFVAVTDGDDALARLVRAAGGIPLVVQPGGVGDTLRQADSRMPADSAVLIGLGDQPGILPAIVRTVLDAGDARGAVITRPVAADPGQTPGHPVLVGLAARYLLAACIGDTGLSGVPAPEGVKWVPIPTEHLPEDVDTVSGLQQFDA